VTAVAKTPLISPSLIRPALLPWQRECKRLLVAAGICDAVSFWLCLTSGKV